MSPTLPLELYRVVLTHVADTSSLYNLLLVNQFISYEAERVLYHTAERQTVQVQMAFMRRVLACPRVAAHVHNVDVAFVTSPSIEEEFWGLVSQTLRVLVNLQSLRLFEITSCRPTLTTGEFPFRLKTLVYWGGSTSAREIAAFLGSQDGLEKLVFHSPASSALRLPSTALPNLKSIQADASTILALLPGRRNVESIRWSSCCAERDEEGEETPSFGIDANFPFGALDSLKSLSFSGDTGRFPSIAKHLGGLESLEVHNPQTADMDALQTLRSLRCVILNNVSPLIVGPSAVKALFDTLKSLQVVYIENYTASNTYSRWRRAGDGLEDEPMIKPRRSHWAEAPSPKFEESL